MEHQNRFVITMRWLFFIPGAFLGAWLAWIAIYWGNAITMTLAGVGSSGLLTRLFIEILSNAAMGAAFVYVGSRIAPAGRKIVSYLLAVLAVLIAGFLAFPAILQEDWWAVVGVVAMAFGAGVIVYGVAEGELDLDTHRLS